MGEHGRHGAAITGPDAERPARWPGRSGRAEPATALLAVAVAVIVACLAVMTSVGEDVVVGDGLELRDASSLATFVDHRTPALVQLARLASDVGSVMSLVVIGVVAAALLRWRGARILMAVAPLLSLAIAGAAVGSTKLLVGRTRPPLAWRLVVEGDNSFPSGHASDSAALFLTLGIVAAAVLFRRPLARLAAVTGATGLAGAVALSRLELGVHWPTDVIVGSALGTAVALSVSIVVLRVAGRPRPAATTTPDDDGNAVVPAPSART